MKHIDPKSLDLAFVLPDCPMFSDLIARLTEDQNLPANRIRDMVSGLRRTSKALGRAPEDVPADPRWLQPRLAKIAPAALGLSLKSWQNAVSDARSAMAHFGIVSRRHNHIDDLGPAWRRLWTIVLASRLPTLQPSLCRFVHFLNRHSISPEEVVDEHALAFLEAVTVNEISKSPEVAYRAAVDGWNLAGRRLPVWPRTKLIMPPRKKMFTLPPATFPDSFNADLEHLAERLRNPDPLDPDARLRPLKAPTIQQYRHQLKRFASELVASGVPPAAIDRLAVLVEPAMAERGLRQMLSRNGNETNRGISEMAGLLRNVSKTLGMPDDTRKRIAALASRVALKSQNGMTAKNRDRLRVLQDERRQRELLTLPERLFYRSSGTAKRFTLALAREDALAIAILLMCPVRAKNLAEIHLDRNIQRPGDGRTFLVFEDAEVKNARPIEFELPADLTRMLDRHLASRSPELCPKGTPWLFPRRDGRGPIHPNQLALRLARRIRRETGLEMNAHLFRHFAVMIWLDANPGGYEVARRLLGHSELSHTLNMYSGMEGRSAIKAFSDLVTAKQRRSS